MALDQVNNGDSGLVARTKINNAIDDTDGKLNDALTSSSVIGWPIDKIKEKIQEGGNGGVSSTWEDNNASIRSLTAHIQGADIGSFETGDIFEFNALSEDVDDDNNFLRPDNVLVSEPGRWVKKISVVTKHQLETLALFGFVLIDFNGRNQVKTIDPVELTYDVEIIVANHEQAETALIEIIVTNTVIVTMPNNSLMQDTDPRWNSITKELTIEGGVGSILELSLSIVDGENKWILSDNFI